MFSSSFSEFVLFVVGYYLCSMTAGLKSDGFTKCEHDVVKINDHCYMFDSKTKKSWMEAKRYCRYVHAQLAQPKTMTENEGIKNYIKHIDPNCNYKYWFGLYQKSSLFTMAQVITADFAFLDDKVPSYQDWTNNQPSGDGLCVQYRCALNTQLKWYDLNCSRKLGLICQLHECPADCRPKEPLETKTDSSVIARGLATTTSSYVVQMNVSVTSPTTAVNDGDHATTTTSTMRTINATETGADAECSCSQLKIKVTMVTWLYVVTVMFIYM